MTERLSDVSARLDGIRQLGAVVNAMTGIAASRARQAREQITAIDSYAATIAAAMAQALSLTGKQPQPVEEASRPALLIFSAEQGFAGAFSERVFTLVGTDPGRDQIFLIGSRGKALALTRGIEPVWDASMPSHSPGIPKLAERILQALFVRIGDGRIDRLDAVFTDWRNAAPVVARRRLFPVDLPPVAMNVTAPLTNLSGTELIEALGAGYLHAQICHVALHAFAAENEARMAAMAAARSHIEKELETFQALERRVRQEAITAEIIELSVR
ncbi:MULTISPECIES: F0F1 ATP synthase subunit gamma [unclassified Rhizobium]|uniref:F0F1 ATP synthase subunit gamma n=1 Tax=unclassified Rhizobium TaxID=2613769 RepID=UPI001ADB6238|nr:MULTISPECIES: F0F1 ATP synthase subunit gamma [unclassified Rhizobium]MBO9099618.1 F0F1 ATP synthase subunit gamma [Rhizobium sp. L58/93]QXZ86911.1 F0F1 ATP synthase subunit gamma [Rhizobium sp. K1/93]QXZ93055.1 F0F1 ATP synthase subunit gamma [Rhizobium sp. K15/93]